MPWCYPIADFPTTVFVLPSHMHIHCLHATPALTVHTIECTTTCATPWMCCAVLYWGKFSCGKASAAYLASQRRRESESTIQQGSTPTFA